MRSWSALAKDAKNVEKSIWKRLSPDDDEEEWQRTPPSPECRRLFLGPPTRIEPGSDSPLTIQGSNLAKNCWRAIGEFRLWLLTMQFSTLCSAGLWSGADEIPSKFSSRWTMQFGRSAEKLPISFWNVVAAAASPDTAVDEDNDVAAIVVVNKSVCTSAPPAAMSSRCFGSSTWCLSSSGGSCPFWRRSCSISCCGGWGCWRRSWTTMESYFNVVKRFSFFTDEGAK